MQKERQHYEETMKKAFMRGVCALNLEAMTMFQEAAMASEEDNQRHGGNTQSNNPIGKEFIDNVSQWTQNQPFRATIDKQADITTHEHATIQDDSKGISSRNNKATVKATLTTRNQQSNPTTNVKVERHHDDLFTPHGDVQSKKRSIPSKKISDSKSRKTTGAISKSTHLIKVVE